MMISSIPNESFYFARHGETDWNEEEIFQSPRIGNHFLNDAGQMQAEQTAEKIAKVSGNFAIIASKLHRTMQTAEIIAKKLNTPVHPGDDLHEKWFGNFKGMSKEDYERGVIPQDAEADEAFKERISRAIPEALNMFDGYTKVIVSHSLVFKHVSATLTGVEEKINFAELVLFTPPKHGSEKWTITRLS